MHQQLWVWTFTPITNYIQNMVSHQVIDDLEKNSRPAGGKRRLIKLGIPLAKSVFGNDSKQGLQWLKNDITLVHHWHHSPSRRTFYGGLLRYNYYIAGDLISTDGSEKSLFSYSSQQDLGKMADVEKQYIAVPSWKMCIFEKVVPCFSGASVECCVGFAKWLVWNHISCRPNKPKKVWNENQNHHVVVSMGSLILESWKIRAPDPGVVTIKMTTWTLCGWWRTCMYIICKNAYIYTYHHVSYIIFLSCHDFLEATNSSWKHMGVSLDRGT